MNPNPPLQLLYQASRLVAWPASEHDKCTKAAVDLQNFLADPKALRAWAKEQARAQEQAETQQHPEPKAPAKAKSSKR